MRIKKLVRESSFSEINMRVSIHCDMSLPWELYLDQLAFAVESSIGVSTEYVHVNTESDKCA